MDELPEPPQLKPGIYEHYKGNRYEVIGVGLHTENLEPLVIYKPLYKTAVPYFVRPFDMFTDVVDSNGTTVPRFKKVD